MCVMAAYGGDIEVVDAQAVEFSTPVQSVEALMEIKGVYMKQDMWNQKSYYEHALSKEGWGFAMWHTACGIYDTDGGEIAAPHSWVVTPKTNMVDVWATSFVGADDTSLAPPAQPWGPPLPDGGAWLASVDAVMTDAQDDDSQVMAGAEKHVMVASPKLRGSVKAEVARNGKALIVKSKPVDAAPKPKPPQKKPSPPAGPPPKAVTKKTPAPPAGPPPKNVMPQKTPSPPAVAPPKSVTNIVSAAKVVPPPPRPQTHGVRTPMVPQPPTPPMSQPHRVVLKVPHVDPQHLKEKMQNARDSDELMHAVQKMIKDACANETQQKSHRSQNRGGSHPQSMGNRDPTSGGKVGPMRNVRGVQTRDAKGRKRGGWYNRCQLVMEAVLAQEFGMAQTLSEYFFNGDDQDDDQSGDVLTS